MTSTLVTGVTGQDGAYLAEYLLQLGYTVYGVHQLTGISNTWRLEFLGIMGHPRFRLYGCDLTHSDDCKTLLERANPDEIYNLAAQSSVGLSFKEPLATAQSSGMAALNLLEAIRIVKPSIRFFQASSSELFGQADEVPQTEHTPFHPRSPYAVAKLFAHWSAINYRESYGIFAACGILYNHESPLRSLEFVTRKITNTVARIALGHENQLVVGNLDISRDWGYAKEYVVGMHQMMQYSTADTFVLATNPTATIREFTDLAFQAVGIDLVWEGTGLDTRASERKSGQVRVRVDEQFYRPCEAGIMRGDSSKAYSLLGWCAETRLEQLCGLMVREDMRRVERGIPF